MSAPVLEIADEKVVVRQGRRKLAETGIADFAQALDRAGERGARGVLPRGTRLWWERRDAVAVAIEVPPHARTVSWLSDDSVAPFGPRAKYRPAFLAFPWVVILLVFRGGSLTGRQQLYYRIRPVGDLDQRGDDADGEGLLLPNLYNVAKGYGQQCWLCLAQLDDLGALSWPAKIDAVVGHTFTASFNRSAEKHEGNSYWGSTQDVDPRVATVDAWETATRENPRFALDVAWRPAGKTVGGELRSMLDEVVAPRQTVTTVDLAGLVVAAGRHAERAGQRGSKKANSKKDNSKKEKGAGE